MVNSPGDLRRANGQLAWPSLPHPLVFVLRAHGLFDPCIGVGDMFVADQVVAQQRDLHGSVLPGSDVVAPCSGFVLGWRGGALKTPGESLGEFALLETELALLDPNCTEAREDNPQNTK